MEKKSLLVAKAPVEIRRAHMKPTTFLKKYGRILIGGMISFSFKTAHLRRTNPATLPAAEAQSV